MSGTLLSDLDSNGPSTTDDSAVQRILNEMNGPSMPQVQSRQPTPAHVINAPNPNTTVQHSMDSQPPTAHIIGNEHPTNADFAAMMYGGGRAQAPQQYMPQNPYAQPIMAPQVYAPTYVNKKGWYSDIATELKIPILVSLLFFVFSLPFISVLISHYMPGFVKATGELTTIGLLIKSILAGFTFWVLHRIVAPLLTGS